MRILSRIFLVLIPVFSHAADLKTPGGSLKKMTWAHYTAWHNPLDTGFAVGNYYNYPVFKSENDQISDYRREFALAKKQGIDGFFVDIISNGNKPAHYVQHMITMLKAAEGTDFQIGPCLDHLPKPELQIKELTRILRQCGKHPNYPRVGNKYVVATYSWYRSPKGWEDIRQGMAQNGFPLYLIANVSRGYTQDLTSEYLNKYSGTFEMAYEFTPSGNNILDVLKMIKKCSASQNAAWMCPVYPGYVGAWLNGRNDFYQPHLGFDQVLECFDAVNALSPQWIHFTTWNDHDETSFMPMAFEFGANTQINRYLLDRWRGLPLPGKTQLFFAYHREEIIGTVLRIEGLLLPGSKDEALSVACVLTSPDGKVIRKLPKVIPKTSGVSNYARFEWNIPTAELGSTPAIVPVITVTSGGTKRTAKMPSVMLVTGWLQNQTTMKVPFDLFTTDNETKLEVMQTDHLLTAQVSFKSSEPIVRAELFRNDRPIGPMTTVQSQEPRLFAMFNICNPNSFAARIFNGRLLVSGRKSTDAKSPYFAWTEDAVVARENVSWNPVKMEIEMARNGWFAVKVNRHSAIKITLDQLLEQHEIIFAGKKDLLKMQMSNYDNNVNDQPDMPGIKQGKLHLSLWSRLALDNDIFHVRFTTASGNMFFSPPLAPFTNDKPISQMVLQTMISLETSSGASGKLGRTGFLGTPPHSTPSIASVNVHPASLRRGRWTFEKIAEDELGERPITTPQKMDWHDSIRFITEGGHNGGKCVIFNGKNKLKLRCRVWPMGPCTIDLYIRPEAYPEVKADIVTRSGWASGFNLYLLKDGKIEVVRDGLKSKIVPRSMISRQILPLHKWTRLRLTYDGRTASLYINNKLSSKLEMPFHMMYGNCIAVIGKGFTGKIDDLTILSYPAIPDDKSFPPAKQLKTISPVISLDAKETAKLFHYSPRHGNQAQTKLARMLAVFNGTGTDIAVAPSKTELGKLIKKLAPPKPNQYCVEIKGNPSVTGPDEAQTKAAITVGKDGAFSICTNSKSLTTGMLTLPVKLLDGQELVVKVKKVTFSPKPGGWIATFIGISSPDKKNDYAASLSDDAYYTARRAPKWKPLGGDMKVRYPLTLQIRRLNGVLTFIVNGSTRTVIKEGKDFADVPYLYINSQKKNSWSIIDVTSMEIREVNKAAKANGMHKTDSIQ